MVDSTWLGAEMAPDPWYLQQDSVAFDGPFRMRSILLATDGVNVLWSPLDGALG